MQLPIFFKTQRQSMEFPLIDPRLMYPFAATLLAFYSRFRKPWVITSVRRTIEENKKEGGSPTSGHIDNPVRSIDVRVRPNYDGEIPAKYAGLTAEERTWIRDFWYKNFRYGAYWSCVDEGDHLHFQCPARQQT